MARPSKLTPARQHVIVAALRGGATRGDAARKAGVEPATLSDWLRLKPAFRQAAERGESEWAVAMVMRITVAAARGDWRAALAILEKHPRTRREWGPNATVTIEGGDAPVRVAHAVAVDPEQDPKAELARLAAAADVMVRVGLLSPPQFAALSPPPFGERPTRLNGEEIDD